MNNTRLLEDKNIVITGASSGIGRTCAIECSKAGARVHLIARNVDKLAELASHFGSSAYSINKLDVTKSEDIDSTVQNIVEDYGKIDGFIHSAGIQIIQPFRTIDKNHYTDVFSVNTIAAFDVSRSLIKKKYGSANGMSLVFISSVMSVVGDVGLTSYCASKAALVGGARAMALELAPKKIRVNCVSPGTVEDSGMTERTKDSLSTEAIKTIFSKHPLGLGRSGDVAGLCVYLLSDYSRWVTGQNIVIDGGYSVY